MLLGTTKQQVPALWTPHTIVQLSVLAAAVFTYETSETIPVCALTAIASGFHVSEAAVGALLAWYSVVAAIITVPLVRLTASWSRRSVLLLTLTGLTTSQIISALAPNFAVLTIARILCAITHGLLWAVVAPIATRLVPPSHAGRATTVIYIGSSLSLVIGDPLVTALSAHWGWRIVVGIVAGIAASVLVVSRIALPALKLHTPSQPIKRSPRLQHSPVLRWLNIMTFIAMTAHFISYTFIVIIIGHIFKLDSTGQAVFLAIFGIAGLIAVPAISRPLDYRPRQTLIACLGALTCTFIILFGLVASTDILQNLQRHGMIFLIILGIIALSLWGASATTLSPILQSIVMKAAPENPDRASSVFVTAFQMGITAGSLMGGFLYEHVQITGMVGISGLLAVGILIIALAHSQLTVSPSSGSEILDT